MTLVIVEKFHLVIGLCARHGMVVDGTESWSIVEKWQRRLGGEHGFVEGGANRSLCNRKNSKRTPVHVRDANVVSDHRTVVGVREPAHLHRTGDFYSGGPGCAAIQRGGEAHVQLAGAGGATLVGIVVVNDRDVRISTGSRGIDSDAGDEVIERAAGGVDGNATDGAPGRSIGGGAHDDVVGSASGAEAAIGPHDENFAGSINAGRRQVGIAQSGRNEVALDAGDSLAAAPAYAAVGRTKYVNASALEGPMTVPFG